MNTTHDWTTRNAAFADGGFESALRMMPSLRTIVIGCVDPRVDPTDVLGLAQGEVAAIRNVGGRVTPEVLDELAMLRAVTRAAGADLGDGWELVVLHHTDCGITRLIDKPEMLAPFFGIDVERLADKSVADPRAAIIVDVAALRSESRIPGVSVSGLVYDVATGLIETVVPA
jgi:carbonic anhydrase